MKKDLQIDGKDERGLPTKEIPFGVPVQIEVACTEVLGQIGAVNSVNLVTRDGNKISIKYDDFKKRFPEGSDLQRVDAYVSELKEMVTHVAIFSNTMFDLRNKRLNAVENKLKEDIQSFISEAVGLRTKCLGAIVDVLAPNANEWTTLADHLAKTTGVEQELGSSFAALQNRYDRLMVEFSLVEDVFEEFCKSVRKRENQPGDFLLAMAKEVS